MQKPLDERAKDARIQTATNWIGSHNSAKSRFLGCRDLKRDGEHGGRYARPVLDPVLPTHVRPPTLIGSQVAKYVKDSLAQGGGYHDRA